MHDDMPDAKTAVSGDDASHLEAADVEKELDIENDPNEQISYHEGRKIIHKIDRRLITALGLMFAVSLMDRTNLGNANIAGMGVDLGLTKGFRYSTIIILFFVPYVILQWPSAIVVRKLGPRVFLPAVTFLWGIVQLCFGFVDTWGELAALRVIVGIFEAGLFPGAVYLVSVWYCRYDVHKRYSFFYLISVVGSSLSGVLAAGFSQMGGVDGLGGWRWIFIWEGILTILIAIAGALLIVDFPQKAQNSWKFLKPEETAYVIRLLERDRKDVKLEPFTWHAFLSPAMDWKVWAFGFIFFCNTVVAYAISYFLPLILSYEMGFSVVVSQVMSTPPYIFSGFWMYAQGWLGDKYHIRSPFLIFNSLAVIVGLSLMAWTTVPGVQYFGVFLVASGSNANVPADLAYQANNIRGQWKRAFCSASLISFGGTGGIVGALVFRSQDAPQYLPGIYASIACMALTMVLVVILTVYFRTMNRKADRGEVIIEGLASFRYTL